MAHGQRLRPAIVAFDVVGTLFSLDPVAARMRDVGLPDGWVSGEEKVFQSV